MPKIKPTISRRIFFLIPVLTSLFISAYRPLAPDRGGRHPGTFSTVNFNEFQVTHCMKKLPVGIVEGEDVECGYLSVPEDHSDPEGKQIQLAVMVIKTKVSNPQPDPLVMAQGGPGGSTIEAYADTILTRPDFIKDRDIVLFDQRGTHFSKPNLYCDQIDQLTSETIQKDLPETENQKLYLEALEKCRQQLVQQDQVDLSNFDSLQNAEDIESLRKALGYVRINYYGVSYGSLLGLHYMRLHPESLRSVVLDAVIAPQTNFVTNSARTMNQSFDRLFKACQNDPDCNREYPDLERTFSQLVNELDQKPARISMSDRDTGAVYPSAVINGTTFIQGIFQMLYAGNIIPGIPKLIYDARDGNWDVFGKLFSLFVFDHTLSLGMYYSVMCAEDADYSPDQVDMTGLPPEIIKAEKDQPVNFLDECKIWNVEELGPQVDQPVTSSIPTLLLSGYFDPIAPPEYAEQVAETLNHSYHFIFPNGGHGQALGGACSDQIIRDFLNDPGQRPDDNCIDQLNTPNFITSDEIIDFPVGIDMLNLTNPMDKQLIVFLAGLLFLLTALPIIPLLLVASWLRRKKTSPPAEQIINFQNDTPFIVSSDKQQHTKKSYSFLSRAAGWIAFIAGPILLVFAIGLAYNLIQMAFTNDMRVYFGLESTAKWLFWLPPAFGILCLLMLVQTLLAWLHRDWSLATRVYFSLLTLAALTCFVLLTIWGVFSVPLIT